MKTQILTVLVILGAFCFGADAFAQEKANTKAPEKSVSTSKSSTAKPTAPSMQIGAMKRDDFVPKECGCAYYNPTSKREDGPLLMWINQQGAVSVNVDGRDRKLKVIKEERVQRSNKPSQSKIGAGDRVLMTLKGETLSASIVNVAERNCTVGAECSHFTWQSTVNLSEYDARKSVKAWQFAVVRGARFLTRSNPRPRVSSAQVILQLYCCVFCCDIATAIARLRQYPWAGQT